MDLTDLKTYTAELMNHVHYVNHSFSVKPKRDHFLTAINYSDIKERKEDFLNALVNTITGWVYNRAKQTAIFNEQFSHSKEIGQASSYLTTLAHRKFRPGHPQGQFGELLLFNFLQHFFHAVPILRKQSITTNKNLERNGADAVHFTNASGKNTFFLGESKCYESKYQFGVAFEKSLISINDTFTKFDTEMDQYTYEDFIDDNLLEIAKEYKRGKLKDVHFELVCIIIYNENTTLNLTNEEEIKKKMLEIVEGRCQKFEVEKFNHVNHLIDRIHYIFFPVWALDDVLDKFSIRVGSKI